jgi:predicted DNA-binding transcriptional regulator YafY
VLARDLEVSVRTVYRDLAALSAAGVPVVAESGPGGGCELLDGYRFALRGLRPEEAEALLILGVPDVLTDLGLDATLRGAARLLDEPAARPEGFSLSAFWAQWSAEFAASLPQVPVTVKASPEALAIFPEVFGDGALDDVGTAGPDGWCEVTLTFEHERAAAHRLAGFGAMVEVLAPAGVRERLLATAYEIISHYGSLTQHSSTPPPR